MAISLLAIGGSRPYISKLDPCKTEEEGASVFLLSTLSSRMQSILQDMSVEVVPDATAGDQGVTGKFLANKSAMETVRYGLVGWRNVKDKGGNDAEFATVKRNINGTSVEVLKESLVTLIPLEVIRELAEEIQSANMMTEEAAKN